ncbi:hypothetical protein BGZ63DRAFT_378753 [Mariannaea sp. PMI_226]|nr:hypothetical protein BGZ63DRAFT_378753 [Mariannaea sp. PMI_226]
MTKGWHPFPCICIRTNRRGLLLAVSRLFPQSLASLSRYLVRRCQRLHSYDNSKLCESVPGSLL